MEIPPPTTSLPTWSIAKAEESARPLAGLRAWPRVALAGVLATAAFLNFYQLSRLGYGNTYYAAGVKSMLESWHTFFFASFDPGGFVTIDKPPLGFWLQAGSAAIFGFHGWSLILPSALAGVLSVALIFHLVARTFGDVAGLLAAAVLAVTPVAVASNRSNIVDSLLALAVLLGAWAVIKAGETSRLRWLLLAVVCVGVGFNIKMLEAFLVVPAFFAVYLLGTRLRWQIRLVHLAGAVVVLLVVSLSWATVVDLTPASQRPFVGSSQDNSEYNLIFGYNGLQRLISRNGSLGSFIRSGFGLLHRDSTAGSQRPGGATRFGPGGNGENGAAGPLRLFNPQLGGQAGWLLPLALIGVVALAWQGRSGRWIGPPQRAAILWGGWLLTGAVFFSVAGFFHSYYLIMLAPPLAALVGAGVVTLWRDYQRRDWRGWLLPVALVAAGLVQVHLLAPYTVWHHRLTALILVVCVLAALALIVTRLLPYAPRAHLAVAAATLGMVGLLIAPAVWAGATTLQGGGGMTPIAGPRGAAGGRAGFGGGFANLRGGFAPPAGSAERDNQTNSALLQYLEQQQGSTKFLVAVENANTAAPIILATGKPVMALGGFSGSDQILTAEQLANLVANGTVRFFLLSGRDFGFTSFPQGQSGTNARGLDGRGDSPRGDIGTPPGTPAARSGETSSNPTSWVTANCSAVPASTWQAGGATQGAGIGGFGGAEQLYDCSTRTSGQ